MPQLVNVRLFEAHNIICAKLIVIVDESMGFGIVIENFSAETLSRRNILYMKRVVFPPPPP